MEQYNYGWLADSRAGLASAADSSKAVIDTKGDLKADWIGKSTDQMFHAADLMARPAREKALNEELMKVNEREQQNLLDLEKKFINNMRFEDSKKDLMDVESLESTGFTYDEAVDNLTKQVRGYGFSSPRQLMYALSAPNAKFNSALAPVRNNYNLMANLEALKLIERKRDAIDSGVISTKDMMMIEEAMRSRSPYGYEQGVKGFINEQMQASSNIMGNARSRSSDSYAMAQTGDIDHKEFYGNSPDGSDVLPTQPRTARTNNIMNTNVSSKTSGNVATHNDNKLPTIDLLRNQSIEQTGIDPTVPFAPSMIDDGFMGGYVFGAGSDSTFDNKAVGDIYNSTIPIKDRANAIFKTLDKDRVRTITIEALENDLGWTWDMKKSRDVAADVNNLLKSTFKDNVANVNNESLAQFAAGMDSIRAKYELPQGRFDRLQTGLIKDFQTLNAIHNYSNSQAVQADNAFNQALIKGNPKDPMLQSLVNDKDQITANNTDLQTRIVPLAEKSWGKGPTAAKKHDAMVIANFVSLLPVSDDFKEKFNTVLVNELQKAKGDENALQHEPINGMGGKLNDIAEYISSSWIDDYNKTLKDGDKVDFGKGIAGANGTNIDIKPYIKQILSAAMVAYRYDKKGDKLVFDPSKSIYTQLGSTNAPKEFTANPINFTLMTRVGTDYTGDIFNQTDAGKAINKVNQR